MTALIESTPISVFVLIDNSDDDDDPNMNFFTSLEFIKDLTAVSIDDFSGSSKEKYKVDLEEENCTYYEWELSDGVYLREYTFTPGDSVTFLKCDGPSSECCFMVPKPPQQFWVEALDYMSESIKTAFGEGDNIRINKQNQGYYQSTVVSYYTEDTESDLMQFELIDNIVFNK
jgi:hypothetical protein